MKKQNKNLNGLVDHIIYLGNYLGIDHIMLGLDMMHFLSDYNNANLDDLSSHKDAQILKRYLYKEDLAKTK